MAAIYPQVVVDVAAARTRTGMARRFHVGHRVACAMIEAGLTPAQAEEVLTAVREASTGGGETAQKSRELAELAVWVTVVS